MTRRQPSSARRIAILLAVVALEPLASAEAAVRNRYTFNDGTTNDSVGTAHGVLVDPGTPTAAFNAGRLDLRANNGAAGNQEPFVNGAYLDLPDGVFTGAVNAGTAGAVSVVAWVNVETNRQNARIWSFGNSLPDGGNPFWGQFTDWIDLNGQSGGGNLALTTHEAGQGFNVNEVPRTGVLTPNTLHQVVATFDQFDTQAGANPDGTMKLYVNTGTLGAGSGLVGMAPLSPFFQLGTFSDVNNWIGRSQWGDPLFDGQVDEIAIFDNTLTAADVAANFTAGPVPTPIPTFVVNRSTGQISIDNKSPVNFRIKSYSITSAAGALAPTGWVSIADLGDQNSGGGFDNTGVWTESSATAGQLSESTPGLGGTVAATTGTWSLGNAWLRTPIQDLQVMFTLSDGSTGTADVSYIGNGGLQLARSDLNADGTLTASDWNIFLASSDTAFPTLTVAQAYVKGDLDADLDNDFRDYRLFKTDFIAANGVLAWQALQGVPEPTAAVLALCSLVGLSWHRRGRRALAVAAVLFVAVVGAAGDASAADVASYVASADPGAAPDANEGAADAWTVTLGTNGGGSGSFQGFPELGIGSSWALFSYPIGGVNGIADADHTFAGGALSVGQSIKIDLANSAVAAGGSVGVSLMSAGVPAVTFKYNGEDPGTVYRYDDAGGADQSTGETFLYRTPRHLEISLRSPTQYIASFGFGAWNGTYAGAIDGVRVFNNMGGDGSDVIFNNFSVGPTTLVPISLEVNKTTGVVKIKGNATLSASLDYYKISSAATALSPTTWNSLDDQNLFAIDGTDVGSTAGDSSGEGWDESDNVTTGALSEYYLRSGGASLGNGSELSLGAAYNKAIFGAADGDLQFVYGINGGPQLTGTVSYVTGGAPVLGDYNGDGTVNAPDLTAWRNTFGNTVAAGTGADGNANGRIDGPDFMIWQRRLGATTAVGATQAVPEFSTCLLAGIALAAGALVRRR